MERENPHLKISQLTVVQPLEFLRSLGAAEVPPRPLRNGNKEKGGSRKYVCLSGLVLGSHIPRNSETSLSLILNTILSEREELLQMEQISLTLDYDVEDEFRFDDVNKTFEIEANNCLLYTSPSPRDGLLSRMPSSA